MKFFSNLRLTIVAAFALIGLTTPTMAATTITTSEIGTTNPGEQIIFDADGVGDGLLSGDFLIFNSTRNNAAALPGNVTNQIAVLGGKVAVLSIGQFVRSLSFDWGSIDAYNTWEVITSGGTFSFSGALFPPANGDRSSSATNRRVNLTFSDATFVEGIRFGSSSNSMEFDNVSVAAVPEPGTWMLIILGFGMIGVAMRRRSKQGLTKISFA